MELYNIYNNLDRLLWRKNNYSYYLDKWLEDNNEDANNPESLDDFEIEEANVYIYEEVSDEN